MYIDGIYLSLELVIFVSLSVMLWVKHAPLSCILVRKEVKDTLIFSAFAFNFVIFFRSSDGIIFAIFPRSTRFGSFEIIQALVLVLFLCSFKMKSLFQILID